MSCRQGLWASQVATQALGLRAVGVQCRPVRRGASYRRTAQGEQNMADTGARVQMERRSVETVLRH